MRANTVRPFAFTPASNLFIVSFGPWLLGCAVNPSTAIACLMIRSAATASGAQDELGDLLRMSDQRQVTGVYLDHPCMHAVGKEALQLGQQAWRQSASINHLDISWSACTCTGAPRLPTVPGTITR